MTQDETVTMKECSSDEPGQKWTLQRLRPERLVSVEKTIPIPSTADRSEHVSDVENVRVEEALE